MFELIRTHSTHKGPVWLMRHKEDGRYVVLFEDVRSPEFDSPYAAVDAVARGGICHPGGWTALPGGLVSGELSEWTEV